MRVAVQQRQERRYASTAKHAFAGKHESVLLVIELATVMPQHVLAVMQLIRKAPVHEMYLNARLNIRHPCMSMHGAIFHI